MSDTPRQTPLLDLLMGVPKDGRAIYEHSPTHSQSIPYGRLCHDAADDLTAAREQIAAVRTELDVANRCLAVRREAAHELVEQRDAARARVAELEKALKPFANFACDEPCQCNNCAARALLSPSPEPTK